ncbi:hypothetical protein [Mesorhizobium sp. INR15]|uniref:hypothetical protein n=1 Tax=Mesorhizobium sp. INR15 TaxID=2654248 RepID=UPI00189648FF|nr:hypothetical protein [Mesorhizobium sp. INR15]
MHDLIDFFHTNATLVAADPVAFATIAILFGSGGFWVGRYFLTERIANLESRIVRRDDEIEDLKSSRSAKKLEPPMVPIIGTTAIGGNDRPIPPGSSPGRRIPSNQSGLPHRQTV